MSDPKKGILQLRRGPRSKVEQLTGNEAELTYVTDQKKLVVHDGEKEGGHPVQREHIEDESTGAHRRIVVVDGYLATEEV